MALFLATALLACSSDDPRTDAVATGDVDGIDASADSGSDDDAIDQDLGPDGVDGVEDVLAEDTSDVAHHAESLLLSNRFLNIAHRGGGALAPEETLVAYENAVAIGADVIEIDVHSTADGVIVCMHDTTVERTTDGKGAIQAMTFEELRRLDAGYRFTRDGGQTFPYRAQGITVPTAEEVLRAFPNHHFSIEIKQSSPSIAAELVGLINELGLNGQVVIASFDDTTIAEVRAAGPDLITAYGLVEMYSFLQLDEETELTYVVPGEVLQIPVTQGTFDTLSPALLARARRFGVRVQVWTVNDRPEMERIAGLGVDGIFTDNPALLAEIIAELGLNDDVAP